MDRPTNSDGPSAELLLFQAANVAAGPGAVAHRGMGLELEQQRRAIIAALAVSERDGLHWRHLLTLAMALIMMTACGVAIAGAFWGQAAHELATTPHHLRGALPAVLVGYMLAALVAAWAWARFDIRRAARRLPLLVVFGAVGIAVLLALSLIHISVSTGGGTPSGSQVARSEPRPVRMTLASALVNREEAASILTAPIGEPDVQGAGLMRGGSLCRYHAQDRSATLTVIVREAPRGSSAARLLDRGEPLPELGDRAASLPGRVFVLAGEWLLSLSVRRRDREATDQAALIDGAQRAVALLPQPAEVAGT